MICSNRKKNSFFICKIRWCGGAHVFSSTSCFSLQHVSKAQKHEKAVDCSTCLKKHRHVNVNSNVTFAVCVHDIKLIAVWWHRATQVSYFECSGMTEYEYIWAFETDKKGLTVCISISSLLHNTTPSFVFASVWLMFIPSGPVTSCSCVDNGITHTELRCCLTQIKTLCIE